MRGEQYGSETVNKARIALNGTPMTELRDVTCLIVSHSVTCYPTQVNVPRPNPSPHAGGYSIYLPRRDGRLPSNATAGSRTGDLSITRPTS